ncbi:MAG: hypothetical protein PHN74_03495 [Candidatus Pacebacteria bacterium]|nr:hypothetical protein [Candidatus Paceibacterota bacterium]
MKTFLKIIIFILIIIAVAGVIYYFWQKTIAPSEIIPSQSEQQAQQESSSKLTTLTFGPIFDYWVTQDGEIYYLTEIGQIIKIPKSGSPAMVSSQSINQLNSIIPSPDGKRAIVKFNYPQMPAFSIFNTSDASWQPLPENIISAAWAPSSNQISYLENKDNSGKLSVLDLATNKTKELIKIIQKDLNIAWPNSEEILFSEPASADLVSSLYALNIAKKTIKPLIKDEGGLSVAWSKEGNLGIKFSNIDRIPKTSIIDNAGNTLSELSFITMPDKCVFNERKVVCGIPQQKPSEGIILPDDYYKKAIYFKDDLYSFDLTSGTISSLLNGDNFTIDARRLTIDGDKLLFINKYDNKLYSLKLK